MLALFGKKVVDIFQFCIIIISVSRWLSDNYIIPIRRYYMDSGIATAILICAKAVLSAVFELLSKIATKNFSSDVK